MSRIVEVDSGTFRDKVLSCGEPVVLEFYSHACPHCRAFKAIYTRLSEVLNSKAKFTEFDVLLNEDNRHLALDHGVRGVPTIDVFYKGRVIGSVVGNHPFENVVQILKDCITKKEGNIAPHTPLRELMK